MVPSSRPSGALAGKWVRTEVTWGDDTQTKSPYPFVFKSVLPLQDVDGRIFLAYMYGAEDHGGLVDAGRMKIVPNINKWVKSYPSRTLVKRLAEIRVESHRKRLGGG